MAIPRRNLNGPSGPTFAHLHAYTLAAYTAAGTQAAAVDDVVTLDATGNWYVEMAPNDTTKRLGIVRKIELDAVSTAVGYVVVEWLDAIRSVQVNTDDATSV